MIGFIDTVLSLLMSTILFKVPLRGSISLLLFLSSIFLFGGLSTGILISIATRTQVIASQVAMLIPFCPLSSSPALSSVYRTCRARCRS